MKVKFRAYDKMHVTSVVIYVSLSFDLVMDQNPLTQGKCDMQGD